MKDPEDYAKGKFTFFGLTKSSVVEGFYVYTQSSIHECLTNNLPPELQKKAVTVFKDLLSWGGEKSSPAPYMNAVEVL